MLYCLSHGELAWHFQNHLQGWIDDLNMLLSCFREKMPVLVSPSPPNLRDLTAARARSPSLFVKRVQEGGSEVKSALSATIRLSQT